MGIIRIQEENMPQSAWEVRIIEQLIKEKDGNIRGAVLRVTRTNPLYKIPPVNRPYVAVHDQYKHEVCSTKVQNKEGSSFYGWLEDKLCKRGRGSVWNIKELSTTEVLYFIFKLNLCK